NGPSSDECAPAGARWPFAHDAFALARSGGKLREAVHRRVLREEPFEHAREQVRASSGELLLIKLQLHPTTARERYPLLRGDSRVRRPALDGHQPLDLALASSGVTRVMQPQELAQRLAPIVHERQVVERQRGDETPQKRLSERWLHDGRRPGETQDATNGPPPRGLE